MAKQKEEVEVEDANHVMLYKSPGNHPGGGEKTYDFSHAKDEEEAADLEADGWFRTLEEAYEDAGVKLKRGGGKKGKDAKSTKAAKGEPDPIEGGNAPTAADVQTAFKALKAAKDMATVTAVLKKFDAVKAADLTEDQYPAAIAAAEKAAAK